MKPVITMPDGYEPPVPQHVPGGADITGERRPLCRPESHGADGKHGLRCLGGVWGYRQLEDGSFESLPPDPMTVPGAVFEYEGSAYVRPVRRGIVFGDLDDYLDDLPEGDYLVRVRFERAVPDA